jgi:hypothetical protein
VRAHVIAEPELEFGGAGRHIDPRFGIIDYGPADLTTPDAPKAVRLGVVGPADAVEGLRRWLERCRDQIPAKDERYPHLFPEFPGCDVDRGLYTAVVVSDRATGSISPRVLREIDSAEGPEALRVAVDAYSEEVRIVAEQNRVDVIMVIRPDELRDGWKAKSGKKGRRSKRSEDEAPRTDVDLRYANFHDILKARVLNVGVPIQIIRRSTFDDLAPAPAGRSLQDEASRAWNLHVALYYKARGVPWRLVRDASELMTLFVGVSFYRDDTRDTLETAVAQVFNERGDGVVVRGGNAVARGSDLQPHLTETDARDLLIAALDTYRQVHKHLPARVVVHKASSFTGEEQAGFNAAADDRHVDGVDMTWVTESEGLRLFRPSAAAPPLRGTHVQLSATESVLYTQGSVDFYKTYPGMYIPQPIGLRHVAPTQSLETLATETLALTKMNWNQTRLDGKLPVTLRTARQVKQVLRFMPAGEPIATRYANYM